MSKSILVILALAVLGANPSFAGEIAPGLEAQLAGMADTDELKVLVVLKDQVDVAAMDRNLHMAKTTRVERHRMVVSSLRDQAAATQGDLLASLSAKSTKGVRGYRSHWLINGVVVTAEVGTIRELALRPDVGRVEPAARIELIEPVETTLDDKNADPPSRYVPDGIGSIRSHEVWYSLGIDGTGTIVGGLDTGVDLLHPALTDKWLARRPDVTAAEAWFIPGEFGDPKGPSDEHGHGTHTMGTMCGVTATDTVGVAPGAEWIASNAVYNYEDVFDIGIIAAMEFFADPDGDSGTTDDVPDVVNNSWGQITPDPAAGYLECDSIYWDAIDNCEAAGVVMIFAAGNEGPTAGSLRMPADRATTATNCFAVGSVYPTPPFLTSFFSSRGPSACGGPHEIKPEVMAPGNGIYSTWPGGGYAYLSGTSMAAPHVSGVVALMRQANPNADVTTIKETLMATAIDIRDIGEDNESGWGLIDAYEAVLAIMPHTGTVSGVITDGSTGLPCEGVMVARVGGLETFTTGPDGAYSFFLPSGVQEFTAKIFGYDDGLISVTILDDLTVNGDLTLNLQPVATVSGTVYDPDGLPLEGAQVEAMETPAAPVSTDAAGYYELVLPIDPGNPYLVRATASGLGFLFQDVSLAGNTTVDFILPPDTTEDFESNHLYDYPWYQTDDTGWHLFWHTTTGAWEGSYCVRSAVTPNSNSSGLAIDYDVAEAGNISFRFRVNTEEFYDLFNFYVDDVVVGTWSGETDWAEFVHAVSAGPHTFKWEYTKDGSYFPVNDGAWVDFITFPLEAVPPGPTVSVSTSNITTILQPDATASVPVTVFNTGAVGLEFNAKVLKVDPAKAAGVDPFGYVWKDSDEPDGPAYDWIDISADGVDAGVADDALLGPFALGFTMPFYGADYDSVWIGTNGFLSFTGDSHDYRNGLIPDAAVPNGHLAFFWDDMRSNQGGTIYYRAEPDSGRFIMQYQDVIRYQTATPHTMQVILKDNGDITYQYADVPEPQSATVGIENADGTVGTQVAYNDPDYLHNGLAIHFDYPGQVDWATVVPDTGSVAPGGNTPISVEFDAAGLPDGTYLGELAIQSNDPVNPVYYVPVTMTVSSVSGVGDVQVPRQLVFQGAVPNPFNPTTSLKYSLPRQARVSLNIYDVSGRLVRRLVSETQQPGPQEAVWDGRDNSGRGAASGLFYARLVVGAEVLVKKMTLVR